jgi:hypothetical protein
MFEGRFQLTGQPDAAIEIAQRLWEYAMAAALSSALFFLRKASFTLKRVSRLAAGSEIQQRERKILHGLAFLFQVSFSRKSICQ